MQGAFPTEDVDFCVGFESPGVYILSRDGVRADYIGRSDIDVGARIKSSSRQGTGYRFFWFEYATSPMRAYKMECEWFHRFGPPDNAVHPAVPPETNWHCPVAGCPWS